MLSRNTLFSYAVPVLVVLAGSVWFLQGDKKPAAGQDKPKAGAPAQGDGMQFPMEKPLPEHLALKKCVGTWDCVVRSTMGPGQPMMESKGSSTERMLGDFVLIQEFKGDMMGMPFTGVGMVGYDAIDKKYWNTWADSMSSQLMVAEGTADEKSKVVTFTGECKDPMTQKPMKLRMTLEHKDDNNRIFTMYMPGPDGKEFKGMSIDYTRRK